MTAQVRGRCHACGHRTRNRTDSGWHCTRCITGVTDGQEEEQAETEAPSEAGREVLTFNRGIAVHESDGLNTYELARLVDMIRVACKDYRMRGKVTITIDGKAIP